MPMHSSMLATLGASLLGGPIDMPMRTAAHGGPSVIRRSVRHGRSKYTGRVLAIIAADPAYQRRECARRLRQAAAGKLGLPLTPIAKPVTPEPEPIPAEKLIAAAEPPAAKKPRTRKPAAPKPASDVPKAPRKTAAKAPKADAAPKAAPRKRAVKPAA